MRSLRSFVPALAGVLVAVGVTATPAPAAAQLTGHVKSIDTNANRLIVTETGTGIDYVITIGGRTLIVNTVGTPLTLKNLHKGDGLAVSHYGGAASKVVADQPRLAGTVKSVDVAAKKLVVTETVAKGEIGTPKEITMTVDDPIAITTTEGKSIKFGDLKEGDSVLIVRVGGVAEKIDVFVKPDELTGFVKSVSADLKTFVLTLTGTTKDVTVAVNDHSTIETTDGKSLKMNELKEGDGVGVAHNNSLASKIVVNVKPPR